MKKIIITIFLLISTYTYAQQQDFEIVVPTGNEKSEIESLVWNRWTTDNFVILSIDNDQGKWLYQNLEQIKSWCITRWGFPDVKFSRECRVMCVPTKGLMNKLFKLTESKFEISKTQNGREITAMWLILDDVPTRTVSSFLTNICFSEFEKKYNCKLNWSIIRGMSVLNSDVKKIRLEMSQINSFFKNDKELFLAKKILETSETDWNKLSVEERDLFDLQSAYLVLLLRQEFGEAKFQWFMKALSQAGAEVALKVCDYTSYEEFDKAYFSYMRDLSKDLVDNKATNNYISPRKVK